MKARQSYPLDKATDLFGPKSIVGLGRRAKLLADELTAERNSFGHSRYHGEPLLGTIGSENSL